MEGSHFVIETDQRSFKYLLEQGRLDGEQLKAKLLGYDYRIQYKEGTENSVVDVVRV